MYWEAVNMYSLRFLKKVARKSKFRIRKQNIKKAPTSECCIIRHSIFKQQMSGVKSDFGHFLQ